MTDYSKINDLQFAGPWTVGPGPHMTILPASTFPWET